MLPSNRRKRLRGSSESFAPGWPNARKGAVRWYTDHLPRCASRKVRSSSPAPNATKWPTERNLPPSQGLTATGRACQRMARRARDRPSCCTLETRAVICRPVVPAGSWRLYTLGPAARLAPACRAEMVEHRSLSHAMECPAAQPHERAPCRIREPLLAPNWRSPPPPACRTGCRQAPFTVCCRSHHRACVRRGGLCWQPHMAFADALRPRDAPPCRWRHQLRRSRFERRLADSRLSSGEFGRGNRTQRVSRPFVPIRTPGSRKRAANRIDQYARLADRLPRLIRWRALSGSRRARWTRLAEDECGRQQEQAHRHHPTQGGKRKGVPRAAWPRNRQSGTERRGVRSQPPSQPGIARLHGIGIEELAFCSGRDPYFANPGGTLCHT